jgi:hypothetical protein
MIAARTVVAEEPDLLPSMIAAARHMRARPDYQVAQGLIAAGFRLREIVPLMPEIRAGIGGAP